MPSQVPGAPGAVSQLFQAFFGGAPGNAAYNSAVAFASSNGPEAYARVLTLNLFDSNEVLAARVLANVGISAASTNPTAYNALLGALIEAYQAFPRERGVVTLNLTDILSGRDGRRGEGLEGNATYGAAAVEFNRIVDLRAEYSSTPANVVFTTAPLPTPTPPPAPAPPPPAPVPVQPPPAPVPVPPPPPPPAEPPAPVPPPPAPVPPPPAPVPPLPAPVPPPPAPVPPPPAPVPPPPAPVPPPPPPPLPVVAIVGSAVSMAEGNSGTTTFAFTVSRTGDTSSASSVGYTVTGTGTNPTDTADFVAGSALRGTVNFAAGQTSRPITVSVAGDQVIESSETFTLTLSSPTGATLGSHASVIATITNDDLPGNDLVADLPGDTTTTGQLQLGVASAAQINPGLDADWFKLDVVAGQQYTVRVDGGSGPGVLADTNLLVYAADGTTVLARDASGNTSFIADSVVTFTAAQTGTVFVAVEAVTISGPITGTYSVLAELTPTVVAIQDNSPFITEGNTPNNQHLFIIIRTGDLSRSSTVTYTARNTNADGRALSSDASDFSNGFESGTVTFSPGDSGITVSIAIQGDTVAESDDVYEVFLSNPVGAALGRANTIRVILNDDAAAPPPNQAPQTAMATATGLEDAAGITVNLSGSDADGTVTAFVINSLPTGGVLISGSTTLDIGSVVTATSNAATVTFVPNLNFNGQASFTFAARDNSNLEDASAVTAMVTVTAVNDAPVANPDRLATVEDTAVTYAATQLLGNDSDVDTPAANLRIASVTAGTGGSVVLETNGSVTFTPTPDFSGTASFTYTVTDGQAINALSNSATVTVDVTVGEDLPATLVMGMNGQKTNASIFLPDLSADSRFLVFESDATNLVTGDTGARDVFRKDLTTGEVVLVSRVGRDGMPGNSSSSGAQVSSDGRFVVFSSNASNLVDGDDNDLDVFRKDLTTGDIVLVSGLGVDGGMGDFSGANAQLSADGRFVVFDSFSNNLVAGDNNNTQDIFRKDLVTGEVLLISRVGANGVQANNASFNAQLSADGRFVSFDSFASNLVAGDNNGLADVFRKDLLTGEVALVSRAGLDGAVGNNASFNSRLSADGRFAVFESSDNNLVVGDNNVWRDVFRKDLTTGVVVLVSRVGADGMLGNRNSRDAQISADGRYVSFLTEDSALSGINSLALVVKDLQTNTLRALNTVSVGTQSNGDSRESQISADGRFAVFESLANNLVAGDTNGRQDIFRRDLNTGEVVLVSRAGASGEAGNVDSSRAQISADSRFVVFESLADNLVAGDTNMTGDVFRKDLMTGEVVLVSRVGTNGVQGNGDSFIPQISADGRYVVFASFASNLTDDTNVNVGIFRKDLSNGELVLVSRVGIFDSFITQISADGRYVLFDSSVINLVAGDTNNSQDVFRKDFTTGKVVLISRVGADGVVGNDSSRNAQLSADGRFVVFDSFANNLVAGDNNSRSDIFRKDLTTGEIVLVSRIGVSGDLGNNSSQNAGISIDGRFVVFDSTASNLVAGDANLRGDVFRKDLMTGEVVLVSRVGTDGVAGNNSSFNAQISADGRFVVFESFADNLMLGDTNRERDVFRKDLMTGELVVLSNGTLPGGRGFNVSSDYSLSSDGQTAVVASNDVVLTGRPLGNQIFELFRIGLNGDDATPPPPPNQAPQTAMATATGLEDAPGITVNLSGSDADGTVTAFVIKSLPMGGVLMSGTTTLAIGSVVTATSNAATVTFVPNLNFNSQASFTFAARDNNNQEDASAATATVTVTPFNDAPVLTPPAELTYTDTPGDDTFTNRTGTLSASDVDGPSRTFGIEGGTDNGTTVIQSNSFGTLTVTKANGSFTFAPVDAAIEATKTATSTSTSFMVTVSDGGPAVAQPLVIRLLGVNDTPEAVGDLYGTDLNAPLTVIAANGVTSNDTDRDGDTLTTTLVRTTQFGVLTLNPNGSFSYTPNTGFTGLDSFIYTASDSALSTAETRVNIRVGADSGLTLTGTLAEETLNGSSGDDLIEGGGGIDAINGFAGNDVLSNTGPNANGVFDGGDGDDVITSTGSIATVRGGNGNDTISAVMINFAQGGDGNDTITAVTSIVDVFGGAGDDTVRADVISGFNVLLGGGDDTIVARGIFRASGESGNDTIIGIQFAGFGDGGDGDDTVTSGEVSNEFNPLSSLFGGRGTDRLTGNDAVTYIDSGIDSDFSQVISGRPDLIDARGGDDIITLRSHSIVTGGTGHDLFVLGGDLLNRLSTNGVTLAPVTIEDFNPASAIEAIDVNELLSANELANYTSGTNPFAAASGHLRLQQMGVNTVLQVDLDGAAGAAFGWQNFVTLAGVNVADITTGDFSPANPI